MKRILRAALIAALPMAISAPTPACAGALPDHAVKTVFFSRRPDHGAGPAEGIKGDGTSRSPYQITNERQLSQVGNGTYSANAHYQLQNSVSLSGAWAPIPTFTGVFDGRGNKISNVKMSSFDPNAYVGLFSANSGTIKHLAVDANINASGASSSAGALAGYNSGSIQECSSSGSVSNSGYAVGGLVGANAGAIENCWSRASVKGGGGGTFAGGLSGNLQNGGRVINSYACGKVSSSSEKGGLIGYSYGGAVTSSYYDQNASGCSDTGKGVGLSPAQMKSKASYPGWDFNRVWDMDPRTNGGYPWLR